MLGIIIGVAAVIAMIAIGAGAQGADRGADRARSARTCSWLCPARPPRRGAPGLRLAPRSPRTTARHQREIPERAWRRPRCAAARRSSAGNNNWSTQVYGRNRRSTSTCASGRSPRAKLRAGRLTRGREGLPARRHRREQLFADGDPLGQVIRIKHVPFTVIGVLETQGAEPDGHGPGRRGADAATRRAEACWSPAPRARNTLGSHHLREGRGPRRSATPRSGAQLLRQRHRAAARRSDDDFSRAQPRGLVRRHAGSIDRGP